MRTVLGVLLSICVLAGTGAAIAEGVKYPECKCQNYGRFIKAGETACIKTSNGPQMARCIKRGNVTDWDFLGEVCTFTSRLDAPATPIPASTADRIQASSLQ